MAVILPYCWPKFDGGDTDGDSNAEHSKPGLPQLSLVTTEHLLPGTSGLYAMVVAAEPPRLSSTQQHYMTKFWEVLLRSHLASRGTRVIKRTSYLVQGTRPIQPASAPLQIH